MNSSVDITKERKRFLSSRWLWMSVALLLMIGILGFLATAEDTVDVSQTKAPPPLQMVSVETRPVGSETLQVSAFAEVRPRWSAELRAAVAGRVTKVLTSALAGERVDVGDTLLTIENSQYVADLAEAELGLKQAGLAHWKAKNANLVARKDFQRAGKKPPNDLALKLPELEIAKSAIVSAEARVANAKRQLSDATVVAPFAGFITHRFVSPGQSVNVGDRLIKLVDNTTYELTVQLSRSDWTLLKKPITGLTAQVLDHRGAAIAQARIRQAGGFLDEATRQYKVFLQISNDHADRLLSGDFVRVLLPGITVPAALSIPSSALTQEGYVWHVDKTGRLQRLEPEVLFRRQDRTVIKAPEGAKEWQIAITPLASFLPGQRVRAMPGGN